MRFGRGCQGVVCREKQECRSLGPRFMVRCVLALGLGLAACGGSGDTAARDDVPEETPQEIEVDASVDARVPPRDSGVLDTGARSDASCLQCGDARTVDATEARTDARVGDVSTMTGFPPTGGPGEQGPFATQSPTGNAEGPACVIHRPAKLGEGGRRHPVIIWGMGTGGFNTYGPAFELWASNGFVVAAALLGNGQGDGAEMRACLDYVCETYGADLDCERTGASGHSQGGGGAIMAGRDPRVIATAPIQPYTQQGFGGFDRASITQQHGPMLLLSGTADTIAAPAPNQQTVFDMINEPVIWANLIGGDHVLTGIDGAASYREIVLAWFRLQLMDDESFRSTFYDSCALCSDAAWMVQRRD
jgi:hypothetical protein